MTCALPSQGIPTPHSSASLNERFRELRQVGNVIRASTAVLDGEIVALDKDGLPNFDGLRSRRVRTSVVFYAFDLLYLDGFESNGVSLG